MKLDLKQLHKAMKRLNDVYVEKYLADAIRPSKIGAPSSPIPILERNNKSVFDTKYFDLAIVNLLMHDADPEQYPLDTNVVEMISRLGYDGLKLCNILYTDEERRELCRDVAFNRVPDLYSLFNYLLWVQNYNHARMSIWFYYTLPLWILLDDKCNEQYGYRSRILRSIASSYNATPIVDLEAERNDDPLFVQKYLVWLIESCCAHPFPEYRWEDFRLYLLSTLREFSILTLSTMLSRKTYFKQFRPLGLVTKSRSIMYHQMIVDIIYRNHRTP